MDWGLDEPPSRPIRQGEARTAIAIGIWNTEKRWRERLHLPQRFLLQSLSAEPEP